MAIIGNIPYFQTNPFHFNSVWYLIKIQSDIELLVVLNVVWWRFPNIQSRIPIFNINYPTCESRVGMLSETTWTQQAVHRNLEVTVGISSIAAFLGTSGQELFIKSRIARWLCWFPSRLGMIQTFIIGSFIFFGDSERTNSFAAS